MTTLRSRASEAAAYDRRVAEMVKKGQRLSTSRVKNLGSKRSSKACSRPGCAKKITRLAEKFGDPYCSRVCMMIALGIPDAPAEEIIRYRNRTLMVVRR